MPTNVRAKPTRMNWSLIGLIVVGLIVAGGWSAYWAYVRDQARVILAEQADGLRAQGFALTWDDTRQNGFPTIVRNTFVKPAAASASGEPWSWSGEGFQIDVRPYDLTLLTFEPLGEQVIQTRSLGVVRARFDALRAGVRSDRQGLKGLTLDAQSLEARNDASAPPAQLGSLDVALARDPRDAGRFTLVGQGEAISWPIPRGRAGADRLNLVGEGREIDVLTASGALDEAALTAWASAGGGVRIDDLSLAWAETTLGATADLTLDREGLWNGQIKITSSNAADAIGRLASMGVIDAETAARLSAVLALAAQADGSIALSLEVKRGDIRVLGQVLGRLPRAF